MSFKIIQSPVTPLWFNNDRGSLVLFWSGEEKKIQIKEYLRDWDVEVLIIYSFFLCGQN